MIVNVTGRERSESHPILGGSEVDNRVTKGIVESTVKKGKKYTTSIIAEYYVASYIPKKSEK